MLNDFMYIINALYDRLQIVQNDFFQNPMGYLVGRTELSAGAYIGAAVVIDVTAAVPRRSRFLCKRSAAIPAFQKTGENTQIAV